MNNNLLNTFENYFQLKRQEHNQSTTEKNLNEPQANIFLNGSYLTALSAIKGWNALPLMDNQN